MFLDELILTVKMLNTFITGENRSLSMANKIEFHLDDLFPDDEEIQDFITCFASYRPGGGDYLYNEEKMIEKSEFLLNNLQSRYKIT